MKKLCSLIIALVLLIPAFVFAGNPADTSHPIFSEKNWVESFSHSYHCNDGSSIICSTVTFYDNPNTLFSMSVHTIFGEIVQKNYTEFEFDQDVRGILMRMRRVLARWAQVEKDGTWYTARVERPEWQAVKDPFGKVITIIVVLKDKNGNEVVRREVKRKDMKVSCEGKDEVHWSQLPVWEKQQIEDWIKKNGLNKYGDPKDTVYARGTPLFSEESGQCIDRYDYVLINHWDRPWRDK